MMYSISDLKDVKPKTVYKDKVGNKHSDTIYTFDIETTSLFFIDGKWRKFDYSIPQKSDKKKGIIGYDQIKKAGVCYHCQFSVNDTVYYFRDISEFENVLKKISNPFLKKYCFIHNLSFEFQWLVPILKKYTIIDMIAREVRKPIAFTIKELNIEFRCSYMLTNLSLENSAKKYTSVEKAKGDLDYSILRHPLTPLTEKEKYYCEMDCVCLYHIIRYFLKEYKHIKLIPFTQTGEVRRAYKKVVPKTHYDYIRDLIPSLEEYKILRKSFMGGVTHGNALHCDQLLHNVKSADISSSYPFAMVSEKYPIERFKKIFVNQDNYYDGEKYAKIYVIRFSDIRAKMYNHYISYSHCDNCKGAVLDNGRLVKATSLEMTITDIDYEIIKKSYSFSAETVEIWVAKKDYLPRYTIEFILNLYVNKTKLKGVTSKDGMVENLYMKSKQQINSIYGANVQDVIQSSCIFVNGQWEQSARTDEFIQYKLDEEKERWGLFWYSCGVWVTAYARKNLFERLIDNNYELDFDVVYYDTDSLKILNMEKHKHIFESYNKQVVNKLWKMCVARNISFSKCEPLDIKGGKHLIGEFDMNDGDYTEFITLGAKRYCYRDRNDKQLHMTVSGVSKKAVESLNDDIRNFNKNTFFDYNDARKNIIGYNDKQPPITFKDCNGVEFTNEWETAIVIYPTTYSMSLDVLFEDFIKFLCRKYLTVEEQNNFIPKYKKLNSKKRG